MKRFLEDLVKAGDELPAVHQAAAALAEWKGETLPLGVSKAMVDLEAYFNRMRVLKTDLEMVVRERRRRRLKDGDYGGLLALCETAAEGVLNEDRESWVWGIFIRAAYEDSTWEPMSFKQRKAVIDRLRLRVSDV